MNLSGLLFVALGGAIGSVTRVLAHELISHGRIPWATVVVNVLGSLAIGWLMARYVTLDPDEMTAHAFWVTGFCGGFTTFSTFSWQTVALLQKGDWPAAIGNVLLSVVLCLAATALGWRLGR